MPLIARWKLEFDVSDNTFTTVTLLLIWFDITILYSILCNWVCEHFFFSIQQNHIVYNRTKKKKKHENKSKRTNRFQVYISYSKILSMTNEYFDKYAQNYLEVAS